MVYRTLSLLLVLLSLGHSSPIVGGRDVGAVIHLLDNYTAVMGQDEFPFMAHISVITEKSINNERMQMTAICGGVIITKDAVLTAAHCIDDEDSKPRIHIRVGLVHFGREMSTAPGFWMRKYVKNEGFIKYYNVSENLEVFYMADIAIIWLEKSLTLGKNVQIAPLTTSEEPFNNILGWILGWGVDINTQPKDMLQKGQTRIISNEECQKYYPKTLIIPDMICLLSDTKSVASCVGDSGGPLVVNNIVYGISSFGPTITLMDGRVFCNPTKPEIFTHVGMYMEWIKEKLLEEKRYQKKKPGGHDKSSFNDVFKDDNSNNYNAKRKKYA